MLRSMSIPELNPVSYVVLGLVNRDGPSTPYELKTAVGRGIAYFWQFPHSQIYAESERLARLGLLLEEREQTGRRRRTFRITPEGRAALRAWLAQPTSEPTQLRSPGLLQLYFGWFASPGARPGRCASARRSCARLSTPCRPGRTEAGSWRSPRWPPRPSGPWPSSGSGSSGAPWTFAAAPPATDTGLGADQRTTRRKSGRCRYGGATRCGLLRP